jgi:hypothetical protein
MINLNLTETNYDEFLKNFELTENTNGYYFVYYFNMLMSLLTWNFAFVFMHLIYNIFTQKQIVNTITYNFINIGSIFIGLYLYLNYNILIYNIIIICEILIILILTSLLFKIDYDNLIVLLLENMMISIIIVILISYTNMVEVKFHL